LSRELTEKLKARPKREKNKLMVPENRALRGTFGTKRNEVTRGWGKLLEEELHNLYSSHDTILNPCNFLRIRPSFALVQTDTKYLINVGRDTAELDSCVP
jgi:hypothetical protein